MRPRSPLYPPVSETPKFFISSDLIQFTHKRSYRIWVSCKLYTHCSQALYRRTVYNNMSRDYSVVIVTLYEYEYSQIIIFNKVRVSIYTNIFETFLRIFSQKVYTIY